ncbi:hypothetical protein FRC12_004330 [Ceratobasidium sp. 428]|nr:hypothetical protein FRC12_004330 [Ceratobasidium sp. 428]
MSKDLAHRIKHLEALFSNLPECLPYDPIESRLNFSLDADFIESEGWGAEFNRRMEVVWRSWSGPIEISERGSRLGDCVKLFREAMTFIKDQGERELWIGGWLDKLTEAARLAGAMITSLESTECIEIQSDSDHDDTRASSSLDDTGLNQKKAAYNPPRRQNQAVPKPNLLKNGKLNFPRIPRELYLQQSAERAQSREAEIEVNRRARIAKAEEAEALKRENERLRKATWRAQVKANDIKSGKRDATGKLVKQTGLLPADAKATDDQSISQATTQLLKTGRSKTFAERLSKAKKLRNTARKRTFWQGPGLWIHIVAAVEAIGFEYAKKHPTEVIKRLRATHRDTGLFDGLHESVLGRWFTTDNENRACWKPAVLLRALKESRQGGQGRSKKLATYPVVTEGASQQLQALRESGAPISCAIARSVILGHVRMHAPELGTMTMSDRWIHSFMQHQLGWSYRTSTKAARKRPLDWEALGIKAFLRMVKTISHYGVKSPRMIVNADQTGISLLPTGNKTWDTRGTSQVNTPSHDEKRQFTLVVASSCGGDILPFQSVWGGKENRSLPQPTAPRYEEAKDMGFTYVHGDKRHWSTLGTTKQWVNNDLVNYLTRVRREENLPDDSPAIFYVDAWPVQAGKSDSNCFIPWMAREHPNIKLLFCPAGCTGELQPADTLLQRIVKHVIKVAAQDYFIACSTRQLQAGVEPKNVALPHRLGELRDASVAWMLEAFLYLQKHPETVVKAWEKCQVGQWNLTWEKLTSPAATNLLYATLATDEEFRNELGATQPVVPRSRRGVPNSDDTLEEMVEFGSSEHDASVPVEDLVEALTGGYVQDGVEVLEDGVIGRYGDEDDIERIEEAEDGGSASASEASDGDELEGGVTGSGSELDNNTDTHNDANTISEPDAMVIPAELAASSPIPELAPQDNQATPLSQEGNSSDLPLEPVTEPKVSNEPENEKAAVSFPENKEPAKPFAFALDIAVLGGTHPAAIDREPTRPTEPAKAKRQSKCRNPGKEAPLLPQLPTENECTEPETTQPHKRVRRSAWSTVQFQTSDQIPGNANEPAESSSNIHASKQGVVRGRGRGRARGYGRGRARG